MMKLYFKTVFAFITFLNLSAHASETYFGIEVGLAPTLGMYTVIREWKHFSLYGDFKFSVPLSRSDTYPVSTLSGSFVKTHKEFLALNVGAACRITDWFSAYAAVGSASVKLVDEYLDPMGALGDDGKYFTRRDGSSLQFNSSLGALFRLDDFNFKISYETLVKNINLGIGVLF